MTSTLFANTVAGGEVRGEEEKGRRGEKEGEGEKGRRRWEGGGEGRPLSIWDPRFGRVKLGQRLGRRSE